MMTSVAPIDNARKISRALAVHKDAFGNVVKANAQAADEVIASLSEISQDLAKAAFELLPSHEKAQILSGISSLPQVTAAIATPQSISEAIMHDPDIFPLHEEDQVERWQSVDPFHAYLRLWDLCQTEREDLNQIIELLGEKYIRVAVMGLAIDECGPEIEYFSNEDIINHLLETNNAIFDRLLEALGENLYEMVRKMDLEDLSDLAREAELRREELAQKKKNIVQRERNIEKLMFEI